MRFADMDIVQRREKIKQIILEKKEVLVSELQAQFDISNVTLRNDLIFLERKGICRRLFGKVVACEENDGISLDYSRLKNWDKKERIGKYAASLICPGDSVLLYAGTTTQQVARFIDREVPFIAVTNSLTVALELRNLPKASVVMLGGPLNARTGSTFGLQTINQVKEFNLDKLIISVDAVDAKMGITNAEPFESEINRVILECAKMVIVVADHTKVGNVSFIQMGKANQIDLLVTDDAADPEAVQALRDVGVEVKIV